MLSGRLKNKVDVRNTDMATTSQKCGGQKNEVFIFTKLKSCLFSIE